MGKEAKPTKRRSVCPVACALDLVGDKWTLLIVRDLFCGKAYFNEFCRSPEKIATNILSDRLERLLAAGLIERVALSGSLGRESYRLTERGRSLAPVLGAIADWGLAHLEGTAALLKPKLE